jgi:hypothetical protein
MKTQMVWLYEENVRGTLTKENAGNENGRNKTKRET